MAGTWKEIVGKELRALERNATPHERGEAMKRASRIYRGLEHSGGGSRRRRTRQNPSMLTLGLFAVGGYLLYEHVIKPQAAIAPV